MNELRRRFYQSIQNFFGVWSIRIARNRQGHVVRRRRHCIGAAFWGKKGEERLFQVFLRRRRRLAKDRCQREEGRRGLAKCAIHCTILLLLLLGSLYKQQIHHGALLTAQTRNETWLLQLQDGCAQLKQSTVRYDTMAGKKHCYIDSFKLNIVTSAWLLALFL